MNMWLIYLPLLFLRPELPPSESIRPKSWDTFNYKAPLVKLHHRFRVTIKVRGNQDEDTDLGDAIDELLTDPVEYLPELTMYNLRLSFKTKNRKYKLYVGRETMTKLTTGNGTYYLGLKIKI